MDELVSQRKLRNRRQAVKAASLDNVQRLAHARLERECAKLNPKEEKSLADEALAGALDGWPEY